ncbi:MAG: prolipoprotein diacylglyceryl transferase [SAR324 cluster bacterium]|nr:prolipoprotein diacylglyceryl transferase [SAR324 cluster bacterium]
MLTTPLLTIETYRPYIFSVELPFLGFPLEPRFYGLFYAISILLGYKILVSESKRRHLPLDEDQAMNCTLLVFLGGLLGGRAYDVIFEWDSFAHKPWWEAFAVWHGGLAIHGGILGGTLAVYLYTRVKKLRFLEFADIGALCIILGQAIGRWGNFTNGEVAGPVTDFWGGVVFPPGSPTFAYAKGQAVHPTMIYESIGNFLIFAILWKLRLKNFRPGMLLALHFISYSILRSSLTPLRMDNQYFTIFGEKFLAAYSISAVLVTAALLLIWKRRLFEQEDPVPQAVTRSSTRTSKKNRKRH